MAVESDVPTSLKVSRGVGVGMPQIHLDYETVARLDALREEDEEYDELINELMNIYEASERTLFHAGDEY
ncbi:hypothetical protein BN996_01478 [Haloferax massiliensis]|uniref:Uncharacterized protein n=1 Tax=Haloferax massiliensis TaxID=1476858 RepID=A0A0D6JQ10_9EURY|nr:hypothetical protein BN996_01478 [Haloferax massiliensis]